MFSACLYRGTTTFAAALTSIRRLTDFLCLPELNKDNVTQFTELTDVGVAVRITEGEFRWEKAIQSGDSNNAAGERTKNKAESMQKHTVDNTGREDLELLEDGQGSSDEAVLTDINLEVKEGELVAIVGKVGAGKTALLNCLLGELLPSSGMFPSNPPNSRHVIQSRQPN